MTEWHWIDPAVVFAVHDYQLGEHGGSESVRDHGLIKSAQARPRNLAAYGEPDAADLAAAFADGLTKNHGFIDGNKRTGWGIARLFLADNGFTLQFDKLEAVRLMEALAGGAMDETAVAAWFRERIGRG